MTKYYYSNPIYGSAKSDDVDFHQAYKDLIHHLHTWTPYSARACPMCIYDNGKFISRCQPHQEIDKLKARIDELTEAAQPLIELYKKQKGEDY